MATYLLVNVLFLAAVLLVVRFAFGVRLTKPTKAWWLMLLVLLILTAAFDSMIVGFGMVAYDPQKILGVMIGTAPIEDFFYAVLAAIIIPVIWHRLEKKYDGHN